MDVTIITIGDELLIGQVVDTNSAWMGKTLNNEGFRVKQIFSISDDAPAIMNTLERAMQQTDIVLITGGLGPTKDDITKSTLARFFNSRLVHNEDVLDNVKRILLHRLKTLNPYNLSQAMVPDKCTVFINEYGTAPAMWFEQDGKVVASMAGVPLEMKHSMTEHVIPALKQKFHTPEILHKTISVANIPESVLAEQIEDIEDQLPQHIKLAYLPSPGIVRLRLTATGNNKELLLKEVNQIIEQFYARLGSAIIGEDDENIEIKTGELLTKYSLMLGTAESCTGGAIASLITTVAGSSAYFAGSVVAYQNSIKNKVLGVNEADLQLQGAVSEPVVKQMVSGALEVLGCDVSIAVSGIAGPGGGTKEKPVGTVWIAVGNKDNIQAVKHQFSLNREYNIKRTVNAALMMLHQFIRTEYANEP